MTAGHNGIIKAEADVAASPGGPSSTSTTTNGLPLDVDGRLPFFYMDAYENPDRPGGLGWLEATVHVLGCVELLKLFARNLDMTTNH